MVKSTHDKIFKQKQTELMQAIGGFLLAMQVNLDNFNSDVEKDLIKNGQLQKFEYSVELCWKFIKFFLFAEKGIDSSGPKDVIREFAKFNFLTPSEVIVFLEMIDDRNKISHEYKNYIMETIYPKLISYSAMLKKVETLFHNIAP